MAAILGERKEALRAREPDTCEFVERDGVRLYYEVFGNGPLTVLLLPTWSIIHSRHWKAQVPFLARHFRVVTFDGRGNGRSDRPSDPQAYADAEFAADALAVMAATDTERAAIVALSAGARWGLLLAAEHPERITAAAFIGPAVPLGPANPERVAAFKEFDNPQPVYDGWGKFNRHYWLAEQRDFLEFFFGQAFHEPHSTKQIEDAVGWGMEMSPETLVATAAGPGIDKAAAQELAARVRCPVLVLHGDEDAIIPHARGAALAAATGGSLVTLAGSGHCPHARDPVRVNLLLRDFISPPAAPARTQRSMRRAKRALFISSPIGLGHALRDVAIAQELRKLHPGLEIDWLAQHPVTEVLTRHGERIHPASALLANESRHIESQAAEHDLHCFEALRRMDEILIANFMLFHDVVREHPYDLWIGDEAWELDYFLHENPEEKRAAYAWLTDFVGFLPMPASGERDERLTADYNAQMIEHVERYPRLRDKAIFVGNPQDVVPASFGSDLPQIRAWTAKHYEFSGYITGFDPAEVRDRAALRAELGYAPEEQICIVTVGGSAVGLPLLRRIAAAFPPAARRVAGLRMIIVAGPRIDPAAVGAPHGVEVASFVPDLYKHLAACDLAIVQGGLTTTMELAANGRPFLYFPLRNHFEQNFHVRHRLNQYHAGRCMEYDDADPESIALAIAQELTRTTAYRPVETDGAARAAAALASLL